MSGGHSVPRAAEWLGYLGAIPFVLTGMAMWLNPDHAVAQAQTAQIAYGAAILSFIGGIRWGLGLANGHADFRPLTLAVMPSLVAWIALLTAPAAALVTLIAGFGLMGVMDVKAAREGEVPAWYPQLRVPLTLIVCLTLALSLLRTMAG